jgi:hypothetical protein
MHQRFEEMMHHSRWNGFSNVVNFEHRALRLPDCANCHGRGGVTMLKGVTHQVRQKLIQTYRVPNAVQVTADFVPDVTIAIQKRAIDSVSAWSMPS